jgi:hypothetical protein
MKVAAGKSGRGAKAFFHLNSSPGRSTLTVSVTVILVSLAIGQSNIDGALPPPRGCKILNRGQKRVFQQNPPKTEVRCWLNQPVFFAES